jgi:hypothetical protein
MIVTQTLAEQAVQSATCCLAKIGKKISDLTRYGLDFSCQISEYNLLNAYVKILSNYQWEPECSCNIAGTWWAAGSYPGRLTFLGDGTVSWFINSELGFTGTYTFDDAGSMSIFIEAGLGDLNLVVYPTNGVSFFNESCTIFDGTSYVYIEEEATSANITVPGKYINPSITVDGEVIFSFSGILDVNAGPVFLTNFVTSFNNYMSIVSGDYEMLLISATEFQITGPGEVDGQDVSFLFGGGSITETFAGGTSPGFEETQLVLSNCLQGEAVFNVNAEDIDFTQDITLSVYSLAGETTIAEIIVPGEGVTSLEELVAYLNSNLVPPYFTEFILDGSNIIVRSEDPSYIANPTILNYFSTPTGIEASGTPVIAWNSDFILVTVDGASVYEKTPTGFATEAEFIADFNLENSGGLVLTKVGSARVFTSETTDFFEQAVVIQLNDSVYYSAVFDSVTQQEINLLNEIVCVDKNPPATCPPIYNCIQKEDLAYIIKAINNICSIYKC